jgi:hypothetical protein
VPFIIFLNKADIFKAKLLEFPLSDVFVNYPSGNHGSSAEDLEEAYQNGIGYISELFRSAAVNEPHIYTTCALETDSCVKVFKALYDNLTKEMLLDAGLIQ